MCINAYPYVHEQNTQAIYEMTGDCCVLLVNEIKQGQATQFLQTFNE